MLTHHYFIGPVLVSSHSIHLSCAGADPGFFKGGWLFINIFVYYIVQAPVYHVVGGLRLLGSSLKVKVLIFLLGLRPIFHRAVGSIPLGGLGACPLRKF